MRTAEKHFTALYHVATNLTSGYALKGRTKTRKRKYLMLFFQMVIIIIMVIINSFMTIAKVLQEIARFTLVKYVICLVF